MAACQLQVCYSRLATGLVSSSTLERIASRQSPTSASLPEPRSWARRQSYGVHDATSVRSDIPGGPRVAFSVGQSR